MKTIKPTAILLVLLAGLSLSARAADSGCALLLASSFQSDEPSTTDKFRAYMENLLEEAVLGYGELKNFSQSLDKGILANPVTEEVGLRNYEADVHRGSLQNYVDSGEVGCRSDRQVGIGAAGEDGAGSLQARDSQRGDQGNSGY